MKDYHRFYWICLCLFILILYIFIDQRQYMEGLQNDNYPPIHISTIGNTLTDPYNSLVNDMDSLFTYNYFNSNVTNTDEYKTDFAYFNNASKIFAGYEYQ